MQQGGQDKDAGVKPRSQIEGRVPGSAKKFCLIKEKRLQTCLMLVAQQFFTCYFYVFDWSDTSLMIWYISDKPQ